MCVQDTNVKSIIFIDRYFFQRVINLIKTIKLNNIIQDKIKVLKYWILFKFNILFTKYTRT